MSSALILSAERYEVVRFATVAGTMLLIYDWVILLHDEVEYIWKRKLSAAKVLYLLSRYQPFFDSTLNMIYYLHPSISPNTCLWNYSASAWSTGIGIGITELLCMRTYAIYKRSRKILWFLAILWMAWLAGNFPVVWIFTHSITYGERPDPAMPGCYLIRSSSIVFGSFASFLVFEIVIVVLTIKKGLHHLRSTGIGHNQTVSILYRDGVIFFVCMAMFSLANAFLMALAPIEYLDLLDAFVRISHALLCCRILLNLRRAASEEHFSGTSWTRHGRIHVDQSVLAFAINTSHTEYLPDTLIERIEMATSASTTYL